MTKLHYAARFGDLAGVRSELDRGVPVDADEGGPMTDIDDAGTPLMWAAASRRAGNDVVRLLLARGADPNAVAADNPHATVLFQAVRGGSITKVRTLLAAGADPAHRDPDGYTALVFVPTYGTADDPVGLTRLLVAAGAPLDAASRYGESPLSVASRVGHFDVVRVLLDAGADQAPLEWTPLMRAAALGTPDDVTAELRRAGNRPARDRWERTAWLVAVHAGDVAKARVLRPRGTGVDAQARGGRTALMLAANAGRAEMVRWLLETGADPNEAGGYRTTPLMEAAEAGEAECVRLLLAAGADPASEDHTRTRAVTAARTVDVLHALADAGADLDYVDGSGEWPLKSAAEDGDLGRLEFLLSAGAKVDTTSTGATALHAAARANELAAVRRLLAAGAEPNRLDVDGYTPLHEARSVEVAQALLDAGADVTLGGGIIGDTALEHHAEHPDIYVLLRLAARGPK